MRLYRFSKRPLSVDIKKPYQNPSRFIVTVGINNIPPMMISNKINFQTHLNHFWYGILATPSAAIRTPDVGVIILVKPSPNWNAITVA